MKRVGMVALLVFGVLLSLSAVRAYAHEADSGKCCKSSKPADKQMGELFGAMKEQKNLLDQELGKDKLDMKKINQINDELKKLSGQKLDDELQSALTAQKTMTPEQFKEFMAKRHMCCKDKEMMEHKMFMRHGMMESHASIVVTPDGGVIVMKGHKLSKYDKNLNLVKEVKTETIDASGKEEGEDMDEAPGQEEESHQK